MLYVSGIGCVTADKISAEYKKQSCAYLGIKKLHRCLKDNGIVLSSIKDFGRMDAVSKMTVAATALAIYDASTGEVKDRIGIIGTSSIGSLISNINFFKDYVNSGRKMARGNLFVYTLPSAALAAAAIAFDLNGPTFFEMYSHSPFHQLLEGASKILTDQNCAGMIAIYASEQKVLACFIKNLCKEPLTNDIMTISELLKSSILEL